ncbi:MAG: hypothetical protein QM541_05435 [Flavobacterium sp.]|nr:hypothetical protein [Flavobacterium sp.]
MARVVGTAIAGVHLNAMGLGLVPATQKALQRAGLTLNNIRLIELNEAFAAQSIACINNLALDTNLVNVNGGSIALGNPLGSGGARITTTLLHEMKRCNKKIRASYNVHRCGPRFCNNFRSSVIFFYPPKYCFIGNFFCSPFIVV